MQGNIISTRMNRKEFDIVYKYLDAGGGLKMLQNSNLQFTNATRLNDPFDCHPSLYDYSISSVDITEDDVVLPESDFFSEKGENDMTNLRNSTWICSLSKVHDSLLMWSYYNKHEGICIGINMEKLRPNLSRIMCSTRIGILELEVKYEDIIKKPNYFLDKKDYWGFQVSTKAKAWEHEQEVRLALHKPMYGLIPSYVPEKCKNDEVIDYKEVRFIPMIDKDCFESVYLGINIFHRDKDDIIKAAKKLNPNIKIYQMTIDPDAFRLKEEIIEE